jgi:probable phosphoglycerate mutase
LFRDGCPGGESVEAVGQRADRFLSRLRAQLGQEGDAPLFSHGHILRVLAARWLGLPPGDGRLFLFGTGALSILGYEHGLDEPAIVLWNEERRPSGS